MKFKAAIFDLDGTLIDSTWVWGVMIEKFCSVLNIKEELKCMEQTAHMPPTEFINFIKEKYSLKKEVLEIKEIFLNTALELYSKKVNLKKGVKRLLNLMKENSIKMAIATSCFVELTEIVLKKWEIYNFFSFFSYSEKLNTNKKSAKVYIEAANFMKMKYCECAIFEDIFLPFEDAKKHGFGYFAIEDKSRTKKTKKDLQTNSDCYIKDYDEFIDSGNFKRFFEIKNEIS